MKPVFDTLTYECIVLSVHTLLASDALKGNYAIESGMVCPESELKKYLGLPETTESLHMVTVQPHWSEPKGATGSGPELEIRFFKEKPLNLFVYLLEDLCVAFNLEQVGEKATNSNNSTTVH